MISLRRIFLSSLLSALSTSHFLLTWPTARGFDEDALTQYPCGGQNEVSSERTSVPLNSQFPVQLDMHHTKSNIQILLAVGNNPTGDDFTQILRPTFPEDGPRDFCVGGLMVQNTDNIREGTNATILAMTNGDPSGGLFNCADITFTSAPLSTEDYNSHCSNSTGVRALNNPAITSKNANETTEDEGTSGATSGATSSGEADKPNGGGRLAVGGSLRVVVIALGVVGGLMAVA